MLCDTPDASGGVALDVQGKDRVMERKTEKEPSVPILRRKVDPDPLVIRLLLLPAFFPGIDVQRGKDSVPVIPETIDRQPDPDFLRLSGLLKPLQKGEKVGPLHTGPGHPDQDLRNQICSVIEKIVFFQGSVTGGLNCELAVDSHGVQTL